MRAIESQVTAVMPAVRANEDQRPWRAAWTGSYATLVRCSDIALIIARAAQRVLNRSLSCAERASQ